ncbi:MAG: DNA-3-methyladenine glycosylase I [Acidimicrobiia bacterium]
MSVPAGSGADGVVRCDWGNAPPDYVAYHDEEWGFPVDDDRLLFEKLCLEGFQSGLSWLTILRRRDGFRDAFHGFDPGRVAEMGEGDVERLLDDASIIRHRGKIEATINNAHRAIELVDEAGSLGAFFWSFEPDPEDRIIDTATPESTAMAKELKQRGFRFVGPTTAYAFMQAMGIVNDHHPECFVFAAVEQARQGFERPA